MTREEASFILANIDRRVCDDELNEALDMAIEVLDQEPILDKIRSEIESNRNEWIKDEDAEWHTYDRCLLIIDKYKAEKE